MSVKRIYVEKLPPYAVRAKELLEEIRDYLEIGTVEKVLVTDARDGLFLGRSQREAPDADGAIVFTAKEAPEVGSYVQVRITGAETYDLKGERL